MLDSLVVSLKEDLLEQEKLCFQILDCATSEQDALRARREPDCADISIGRKKALARLTENLNKIKGKRSQWERLGRPERQARAEIYQQMHRNQNLLMKVIVLDRQNEDLFLKNGWVPPGSMPSFNRQRPQAVAGLYSRHQNMAAP